MNTKAAAEFLHVDRETLLELAREGLVGSQEYAGEPWKFTAAEIADLLRSKTGLKANLREAAELHRLRSIVGRLQKAALDLDADLEYEGLQRKAEALARKLKDSKARAVRDTVRNLIRNAGGGAAQVLQIA